MLASARDLPEMDQDDDTLAAALRRVGADAVIVPWDDPTEDWAAADAVVIRSTWDYTGRLDEFLGWTRAVEAAGTALWNPADVVAWNVHKGYLIELEERGAPIVPTAWLGQGDEVALAEIAEARGWDGVVAKPAVAAGSDGLLVVAPGQDPAAHQDAFAALLTGGDTMVQPYVRSITEEGELSIVVVDGRVSHAVRKVPTGGDVRVQVEFGGRYEQVEPAPDAAGLATWLVEATGHDLLYARVDLLRDDDGSWLLGELECVEPSLLLDWAEGGADRLAAAVVARAAG